MSFLLPPKWCYTLRVESMRNGVFYVFSSTHTHTHDSRRNTYECATACSCHWRAPFAPTIHIHSSSCCHLFCVCVWVNECECVCVCVLAAVAFHVNCIKLYQKMKLVRDWDRTSLPFVFKNSTSDTGNKSSLILYLLLQRIAVLCVYMLCIPILYMYHHVAVQPYIYRIVYGARIRRRRRRRRIRIPFFVLRSFVHSFVRSFFFFFSFFVWILTSFYSALLSLCSRRFAPEIVPLSRIPTKNTFRYQHHTK